MGAGVSSSGDQFLGNESTGMKEKCRFHLSDDRYDMVVQDRLGVIEKVVGTIVNDRLVNTQSHTHTYADTSSFVKALRLQPTDGSRCHRETWFSFL